MNLIVWHSPEPPGVGMWIFLVFPAVFYGLSLFLFGSMWAHLREYRTRKAEGRAALQWTKAPRFNAMMRALYGSFFAFLFLISMWICFVEWFSLAGWPILFALLGCLVLVVAGGILMGRSSRRARPPTHSPAPPSSR
jgi:hypothetical protein